jgi:hypothetical protein
MPVDGGPETLVVKLTHRYNFAVLDRGLYFAPPRDAGGKSAIQYLDFATGTIKTILPDVPIDLGLAVSPDGRSLLWSQLDHRGSDLMLIDNFH